MFDHFHLGVVQCYCWRTQVSLPSLLWDPSVLSIRDPLFRLGGSGSRPSSVAVWHLIPLFLSRPHSCPLLAVTQSRASFLAAGGHRLGWGAQRSLCRRLTLKLARQLLLPATSTPSRGGSHIVSGYGVPPPSLLQKVTGMYFPAVSPLVTALWWLYAFTVSPCPLSCTRGGTRAVRGAKIAVLNLLCPRPIFQLTFGPDFVCWLFPFRILSLTVFPNAA